MSNEHGWLPWLTTELAIVKREWPKNTPVKDIAKLIPRHTAAAIRAYAYENGIKRTPRQPVVNATHPVMRALIIARHERGLSQRDVAHVLGIAPSTFQCMEHRAQWNKRLPKAHTLERWANALGFELTLRPLSKPTKPDLGTYIREPGIWETVMVDKTMCEQNAL